MAEYNGLSGKSYRTQNAPFAGGGEGDIYDVVGAPGHVAKVYKPDKRTTERERKLSVMVSNKPSMMEQYAWPLDVLYENGQFVGYIMPKINGKEKLRNIYVFDKRKGKPWSLFIAIAKNLSAAVHNVHEIHQVIGDLNPENILVNPNDGMVTLVDTDSYHISDSSRTYRCGVGMPEFVAPELQGIHFPSAPLPTFTIESDRFALAVLIFALLMNGAHPFSCKVISGSSSKFQPIDNMQNGKCAFFPDNRSSNMDIPRYAPDLSSLPDNIQKLFRRAFIAGHRTPSLRPSAEEWYNALEQLEDNLKTCLKDAQHIYYYGAKECPWCKVDEKMHSISQSAFNSSSQSGSNSGPGSQSATAGGQAQQFTPSNYRYTPSSSGSGTQSPQKRYGGWIAIGVAVLVLILLIKSCSSENGSKSQGSTNVPQTNTTQQPSSYENNSNPQDNTNNSINSDAITPEPVVELRSITVSEVDYEILNMDGVYNGEIITISEDPVVSYSGSISDGNERDTYTYTAPRDGRYRFDLENVNANATLRLMVWDSSSSNLIDSYSNGSYTTLNAGETYEIQVRQYSGSSSYTLNIGVQKATTDISSATTINDQIAFSDQKNVYLFTAPVTGRYRFDLTETNANTTFRLMMWDRLDNNIMDNYSNGGYVNLDEGETYQLQVRQYSGLGSYVMRVYFQKETTDITGYDVVNDSIEYNDQKNVYLFTAPIAGRYRFDLTETNANTTFRLMMWDRLDNNIMDNYSNGGYVNLDAGETYQLQVRQYSGLGSYKMLIGYQKESVDISNADIIYDRITYDDQKNVYIFTPSETRKYTFILSNYNSSCTLRLMAWDKYDNNILDNYNGEGSISLEANQTYQIQVRQYSGHSSYSLLIE